MTTPVPSRISLVAAAGVREEDERRRQPALGGAEVVLRDPRALDAEPLGVADLVGGEPVALRARGVVEQSREEGEGGGGHASDLRSSGHGCQQLARVVVCRGG